MRPPSPGDRLDVHLTGRRVGEIEHRGPGRYRFQYLDSLLEQRASGSLVLSASLPLQPEAFSPSASRPFFEGLLPEGAVRATVARSLGVSEDNSFALMAELGRECAGAVVILPQDEQPLPPDERTIKWLSPEELAAEVADLPSHPLGISPEEGVRLSLGGVQQKLVLSRDPAGRFGKPLNGTPSTHILKPGHEEYEDLVANEAFCLLVSRCAGLPTTDAEIVDVGGRGCLVVTRFDRTLDGAGRLVRLHQEDSCQALGRLPVEKYEADGGPTLPDLFDLLRELGGPTTARDITALLDASVLNFVLGNSDAHAKNFALLYGDDGRAELAPLYDIVCTNAYSGLTRRLAMRIGDTDDPGGVRIADWERLAEDAGLGRQTIKRVRDRAARVLDCARAQQEVAKVEGWHRPVIDEIVGIAAARERQLAG